MDAGEAELGRAPVTADGQRPGTAFEPVLEAESALEAEVETPIVAGDGEPEDPLEDPGEAPDGADVGVQLARLSEEIAALRESVEDREQVGTALRGLADQIDQNLRGGWRPLYMDLILLHDRVGNATSAWADTPAVEEFLATIRDEIAEILARRGVEPISVTEGGFDPSRQRAVKVKTTDAPGLDRTIDSVVRSGYEHDGYLLRPEEVIVMRYTDPGQGA